MIKVQGLEKRQKNLLPPQYQKSIWFLRLSAQKVRTAFEDDDDNDSTSTDDDKEGKSSAREIESQIGLLEISPLPNSAFFSLLAGVSFPLSLSRDTERYMGYICISLYHWSPF